MPEESWLPWKRKTENIRSYQIRTTEIVLKSGLQSGHEMDTKRLDINGL